MTLNHLEFNVIIGKKKPENIINTAAKCPFCDRARLEGIMDEEPPLILLKNKYPVLQNTLQTVLIETDQCDGELSKYSKEHLYKLFRFGIRNWTEMEKSGQFKSVVFFKNHGSLSGGTIRHPHMQIIGLKTIDYLDAVEPDHFIGITIDDSGDVEFNISTHPRIGFSEFNVVARNNDNIEQMADYAQTAVHYILNRNRRVCNSYNLFFYRIDGLIRIKIMPRFPTSPLFMGYFIPQVSNRLETVVAQIQKRYFSVAAL